MSAEPREDDRSIYEMLTMVSILFITVTATLSTAIVADHARHQVECFIAIVCAGAAVICLIARGMFR